MTKKVFFIGLFLILYSYGLTVLDKAIDKEIGFTDKIVNSYKGGG